MLGNDDSNDATVNSPSPLDDAPAEPASSTIPTSSGRRRTSKKGYAVVGAVCVAAILLSTIWLMSGATRPEVVVVAILPLSGASSYLIEVGDAMSLTAEKLNKWGGLNGIRIRLVVLDCASDPELALQKLIEAEEEYQPLAVVTATRSAAVPMAEYAEEHGIVMISIGASPEDVTEGKEWVFRYYLTSNGEARAAFSSIEALSVNTLGILHLNDTYGLPIEAALTEMFESSGGTAESVGFPMTANEFSDEISRMIENDAIFVIALRHQFPNIFSELNESHYEGQVICAVEASIPEFWQLPTAQGIIVNAPVLYNPAAAVDREFLSEFEERFGEPLTHQGAIGADVLKLIWGILSDKVVSRQNLRDLLNEGFIASGIMGVVVLEPGFRNVDISLFPASILGGELIYL